MGGGKGFLLYELTQVVLAEAGFEAYEVSNHARGAAARSVHNLAYWRGWDYVGAGPGAHGRLTLGGQRHATETAARIGAYIAARETPTEILSPAEATLERLLMGIRSVEGVTLTDLAALSLPRARLMSLQDEGLIDIANEVLRATSKGRPVLDSITRALAGV